MKKAGILCFTDNGRKLKNKLISVLNHEVEFMNPEEGQSSRDFLEENFNTLDTVIFIGAAGIAVRMISPLIKSKDVDPAVIVIDELGRYVIPLLSGHIGGANEAALQICQAVGAEPVITTATDINFRFAADTWAKAANCSIMDISKIKYVSGSILRNENVGFESEFPIEGNLPDGIRQEPANVGINIDLSGKRKPFKETLNLVPQIVTLGVGCRRNTSSEDFETFINNLLEQENISVEAVEKMVSIDLKAEEKCILDYCEKYNLKYEFYSKDELQNAEGDFVESTFVKKITGVDNVCERSAVLGSENGIKIIGKTVGTGMTAAIYMKKWKCRF